MPPRIPTDADFAPLKSVLTIALHRPDPPESTQSFLILFHGLGDREEPFARFAANLALPGVFAISVRGPSPVPAALLGDEPGAGAGHFHWGDDLRLDPAAGGLDPDPGFRRAADLVAGRLVRETLVARCGWDVGDVMLFGFGQGGSLALGLASETRAALRVLDITDGDAGAAGVAFKGAVSIGGPLPQSMVPTISSRGKAGTSVLLCQLAEEEADRVEEEFADVRTVRWKRREVAMPRDREEVLPLMKFFAEKLNAG